MDINSRDPSQNIIPFHILGNEIARFDQDGNLGIGTSAPSAKLDVVGSIKLSGVATITGSATIYGGFQIENNSASSGLNNINTNLKEVFCLLMNSIIFSVKV